MDLALVPWLMFGALAAISIVLLVVRGMAESSRRKEVEKLSYSLGFDYVAEDESILGETGELPLFSRGRRRRARNVLRRAEGDHRLTLFDYRYTSGSGRNSKTHRHSVLLIGLGERSLPQLELRPERLFHRLGSAFGLQDIDFEHFPEFSRRYLLRGKDEEDVRQLFTPAVLQTLERHAGWCVEAAGPVLAVYRQGRVKPHELHSFLNTAREIANTLAAR